MENNFNLDAQDSDFLKEKIKQRPLNRKKLLRRTLITAIMAVLFGTIACVTFLLLEPVISNRLYPEEEPEIIEFPEEIVMEEEEILPEDMIADEAQMQAQLEAENTDPDAVVIDDAYIRGIAEEVLLEKKAGTEDYISINNSMLAIAREAGKSMVTVTGVTSDVDWFNDTYENEGQTTGSILWDNGLNYLILVNMNTINDAETYMVTFMDGAQCPAVIQSRNNVTELAVFSVSKSDMSKDTLDNIKMIEFDNIYKPSIIGMPVIAVGRVVGNAESICYGFVTSAASDVNVVDASYKLITTDIYGSSNAAGLLLNMQGQVVGILNNSYNSNESSNMVSAVRITEIYPLIKSMADDKEKAYSGILGTDVPLEAHNISEVPLGAYVTQAEMNSPAMNAGIQSGDVIVKVEDTEIINFNDYANALFEYLPEQSITLEVMRQGAEGYRNVEITMELGHSE